MALGEWPLAKPPSRQGSGATAENEIAREVVNAAVAIHVELVPGLLKTVYEAVLVEELEERGPRFQELVPISAIYRGRIFNETFRADLVVEGNVIVERKSVEQLNNAH